MAKRANLSRFERGSVWVLCRVLMEYIFTGGTVGRKLVKDKARGKGCVRRGLGALPMEIRGIHGIVGVIVTYRVRSTEQLYAQQ